MSDEPTADRDVLANLPRTRPARRSAKRDAPAPTKAVTSEPKARPKPAAAKPKPAAAKPKPRKAATLTPPKPVPEHADAPPPAGYAVPEPDPHPGRPDLLTTALNAGVEVARLSVTLGLRAMRGLTELRRSDRGSDDELS